MRSISIDKAAIIKTDTNNAHVALFIVSFAITVFGGTVSTLMSVYLPTVVNELLSNKNADELNRISAYINAIFILGWTAGGFVWGFLSDRIGRKPALIFSTACFGLATLLTGFMFSWEGIVIFRFVSGFGMGGILVVSNTLMSEVWPQKTKAIFIGILSISFPIGIFSAGLINYLVSDWRQGFFVGALPLMIAAAGYWMLKESPDWKTTRNTVTRKADLPVKVFDRNNRRTLLAGSLIFGTMLIGLWGIFSWLPTWVQTLITTGDGHHERGMSMMLLGMGGLTGGFLSGWLANAIGLRKAMILCFAACVVFCFILFKTNHSFNPILVYSEIGILSLFFGASQGVLSVFIPLLFPVSIRASATGFCFNIGRIVTAAAVLFVGVLVTILGGYGNALFIFSMIFLVGLLVMWYLKPKTN